MADGDGNFLNIDLMRLSLKNAKTKQRALPDLDFPKIDVPVLKYLKATKRISTKDNKNESACLDSCEYEMEEKCKRATRIKKYDFDKKHSDIPLKNNIPNMNNTTENYYNQSNCDLNDAKSTFDDCDIDTHSLVSESFSQRCVYADNTEDEKDTDIAKKVVIQYSGLNDIAGLEDVKQCLRESIIYPVKYPHLFGNGRTIWSRALIYGAPGVGKTVLAQALAAEAKIPLYQVSSPDLTSSWLGESEKLIRRLFTGLGKKRCILFFDEIDSLCRKRTSSDLNQCCRITAELLIQIQNYEGSNMFLLCATNCPWEIDPAFLRRFQQRIYVPLPDRHARESLILSNIDDKSKISASPEWNDLINATDGLTGSDLINITRRAMMIPLREMATANYWKEINHTHMIPCLKDDTNAICCSLESIENWKVQCRPLEMQDLWTALKKSDKTVTRDYLEPFMNFMKTHAIK